MSLGQYQCCRYDKDAFTYKRPIGHLQSARVGVPACVSELHAVIDDGLIVEDAAACSACQLMLHDMRSAATYP